MSVSTFYAKLNLARAKDVLDRIDRGVLLPGQPETVQSMPYQYGYVKGLLHTLIGDLDSVLAESAADVGGGP